eukprot:IDg15570t1
MEKHHGPVTPNITANCHAPALVAMYPPSTQLSPPAPELDTETEDDEDSSDDGYARRPARLSQAALPFVPPPVSSIAPPRRYAPAKLRVSEPQGNPAPTQHGAKKHLLRK